MRNVWLITLAIVATVPVIVSSEQLSSDSTPGISYYSVGNDYFLSFMRNGQKIVVRADFSTNSAYITENGKYLAFCSWSDPLGALTLVRIDDLSNVLNIPIRARSVQWHANRIRYERVLYSGIGFMACQAEQFEDGALSKGEKLLRDYHGGDANDPLSRHYDLKAFGSFSTIAKGAIAELARVQRDVDVDSTLRQELLKSEILKSQGMNLTQASIAQFIEDCETVVNRYATQDKQAMVAWIFNTTYPLVDAAWTLHRCTKAERSAYTDRVFELLGLDKKQASWLYD